MKETKTTENKQTNVNKTKKMTFWDISKSISLMAVALAVAGAVLGWQPFADNSRESISAYAVTENTVENTETNIGEIDAPYTPIYNVKEITEGEFLSVLQYLDEQWVHRTNREMGNCTPKEWLLRYSVHDARRLESVLNTVLHITLAADYRTDLYYVTDYATQYGQNEHLSDNGRGYNMYGNEN